MAGAARAHARPRASSCGGWELATSRPSRRRCRPAARVPPPRFEPATARRPAGLARRLPSGHAGGCGSKYPEVTAALGRSRGERARRRRGAGGGVGTALMPRRTTGLAVARRWAGRRRGERAGHRAVPGAGHRRHPTLRPPRVGGPTTRRRAPGGRPASTGRSTSSLRAGRAARPSARGPTRPVSAGGREALVGHVEADLRRHRDRRVRVDRHDGVRRVAGLRLHGEDREPGRVGDGAGVRAGVDVAAGAAAGELAPPGRRRWSAPSAARRTGRSARRAPRCPGSRPRRCAGRAGGRGGARSRAGPRRPGRWCRRRTGRCRPRGRAARCRCRSRRPSRGAGPDAVSRSSPSASTVVPSATCQPRASAAASTTGVSCRPGVK